MQIKQKLIELNEQGKKFFSYNSVSDGPGSSHYKSAYVSWKTQLETTLMRFGKDSPVYKVFLQGYYSNYLTSPSVAFREAHDHYLAALDAAIKLADDIPSETSEKITKNYSGNEIFIVHGHDNILKQETELLLHNQGLKPVVLHRENDQGKTIIEKFEAHSNVGYAIILLTQDDIGYPVSEEEADELQKKKSYRARQNVIFEWGFFVGKLGRERVCCILKGNIKLPSDLDGIVSKRISLKLDEMALPILRELKAAGYQVNIY